MQLWPSLRYGLGTLTNDVEAADDLLDGVDRGMLSFLGVNKNIKAGWRRRLHTTFGGIGLHSFVIEQFISRVNLLLQHYHTGSVISTKLDTALRLLQLHLGTEVFPFDLPYTTWSFLSLLYWLKMLWRTLWLFGITITLDLSHLIFPVCTMLPS